MTKSQAIEYLKKVLGKWDEFFKYHHKLAEAILVLLEEIEKEDE